MHQPLYMKKKIVVDEQVSALYQQHAPRLFTYLRLHLRSQEDAEDLLVDIFLACLEKPDFQDLSEGQQGKWLWRVARNKLIDVYRRKAVRQSALNVDDLHEQIYYDEDLSPERLMERSEDYLHLYALVQKLPRTQQQVLRLRLVHGLRCSEIATELGKTEGAIRALFARALNVLRFAYGQKEGRDNG